MSVVVFTRDGPNDTRCYNRKNEPIEDFTKRANAMLAEYTGNVVSIFLEPIYLNTPLSWYHGIRLNSADPEKITLRHIGIGDVQVFQGPRLVEIVMDACILVTGLVDFSQGFDGVLRFTMVNMQLPVLRDCVKFPPGVVDLRLSLNEITDASGVTWPSELYGLRLSWNEIADFGWTRDLPPTVVILALESNRIERVELNHIGHTRIAVFDVACNRVAHISMQGIPKSMKCMRLGDNPLEDIFFWAANMTRLTRFGIQGCPLSASSMERIGLFFDGEGNRMYQVNWHRAFIRDTAVAVIVADVLPSDLVRFLLTRYL